MTNIDSPLLWASKSPVLFSKLCLCTYTFLIFNLFQRPSVHQCICWNGYMGKLSVRYYSKEPIMLLSQIRISQYRVGHAVVTNNPKGFESLTKVPLLYTICFGLEQMFRTGAPAIESELIYGFICMRLCLLLPQGERELESCALAFPDFG